MNSFSIRYGDLEARSCNHMLLSDGEHTKAEIVKWENSKGDPTCFAIAVLSPTNDGFELRFVGDRPFEYSNPGEFFYLAKIAMSLCGILLDHT